jgi:3',5'-cyclic-AMP phosphodiesterase
VIIAQISDLHIGHPGQLAYGCIDTAERFSRCVSDILQLKPLPDVVVASGDLVDTGSMAEYRRLRRLLSPLPMRVYLMPGNHDVPNALQTEFADHNYFPAHGRLYYMVECLSLRLIMLDTVVPGEDGGALGVPQLEWLAARLASEPAKPTLIFMHHPPIASGIHYMDRIALKGDDARRLGALVSGCPQIARIACGHLHRVVEARWSGTVVGACPSATFQAALNLAGGEFDAAPGEPPAYQLHCWRGDRLVTHTVQVMGSWGR